MTITIRDAQPDDIAAISAIYDEHVRTGLASFEYDPPGETDMRQRYETIIDGGFPYLVAEQDGRILGYAYAGAFHARKAYEHTVENSVYLDLNEQGRGIGSQLLASLIDECRKRGYLQMIAVISKLDPPVSVKLHEKFGFRTVGTLTNVGFKNDVWLDVVYMQLALESDY